MTISLQSRIEGAVLGVAIGDALGAPFEHVIPGQSNQALEATGGRIEDFHADGSCPPGSWTDDTCMTLATCRAFIAFSGSGKTMGECFRTAFKDATRSPGWRRVGKTVGYAARHGEADVDSWGNGALMRIAPVAIYAHLTGYSLYEAATLAQRVARLTHGHPLATFPAVECVLALLSILSGEPRAPEYLSDPGRFCHGLESCEPARYAEYREVRHGPRTSIHPTTGLWMWRQVFENVLGLAPGAPWSDMPPFEDGLLKAVNESFDRDTAGAVAGALLGAYLGERHLPRRWQAGVQQGQAIKELAENLVSHLQPLS